MKKTMTNKELDARLNVLQRMSTITTNVPALVSYRIVQNIQSMETVVSPFRQMVESAVKKHGKGKNTIQKADDPDAYEACAQEIEEISCVEVEVEIHPFPLSKIKDLALPMNFMFALDIMVDPNT